MSTQDIIEQKLSSALAHSHLDIKNESHMHNVPPDSESHFRVVVVSEEFEALKLLARHRKINAILKEELAGSIHALALHTYTPDEWQKRGESANSSPECRGGSAMEKGN